MLGTALGARNLAVNKISQIPAFVKLILQRNDIDKDKGVHRAVNKIIFNIDNLLKIVNSDMVYKD